MPSIGWALVALALLLTGGAAYLLWGNATFEAAITADIAAVRGEATDPIAPPDLPEIVSAYARRAGGVPGSSRAIRLEHRAELTVERGRPPIRIRAEQWLSPHGSAMAWVGRGSMSGIPVTVIDSFVGGRGRLEARLVGTLQVAGGSGPDFDRGELQRYLSELPVHPDAILGNSALQWRQLDASTVEVTGQSQGGPASVEFTFDAAGDIVAMRAADRPMAVDGTTVPTEWRGTYSDYREIGGYRIPLHGEVGWQLADGLFTYWRGDIVAYDAGR